MGVIRDTLGAVGYALDTPGAYTRGLLAGKPGQRVGGRDMLQSWGVVGENTPGLDMGDVAGFGAEMLVDPLNLIGAGWLGKLANANKGIAAGNRASQAMRAAGAMPAEIVPKLHPSVIEQATGMPKRFYHGTPQAFDQYSPRMLKSDSLYGRGIYLTDAPHVASSYANKLGEVSSVSPSDLIRANRLNTLRERVRKRSDRIASEYKKLVGDKRKNVVSPAVDSPLGIKQREAKRVFSQTDRLLQRIDKARSSIEHGSFLHPQNVRMHYVDSRNPFLMDQSYPIEEINRIARTARPQADYSSHGTSLLGDTFATAAASTPESARQEIAAAGYDSIAHLGGQRVGGLGPHNVTIAFDPSQIYAPYVAPALQQTRSMLPPASILGAYNAAKQFRNRRQSQ
jgi:hypothetical protein